MPTVRNTATDPTGRPAKKATVVIRLMAATNGDAAGYDTAADRTILGERRVLTDDTGLWSVDLAANSTLTPTGTVYLVDEVVGRSTIRHTISVPTTAGPHWLGDLLADPPAGLPGTAMDVHVAAADPHTGYVKETEKGAANGVATLGADSKIPGAQLPAVQWEDITAHGAVAGELVDNTDAFEAAQLATSGIVYYPPGVWRGTGATSGLTPNTTPAAVVIKKSNVTHKGAGMYATTLGRLASGGTFDVIRTSGAFTGIKNVAFEDMTIDWNVAAGGVTANKFAAEAYGSSLSGLRFTRCRFINMPQNGLYVYYLRGLIVEDCLFESPGDSTAAAITLGPGTKGSIIRNNKFLWTYEGIRLNGGSGTSRLNEVVEDIEISGNYFDLGWFLNTEVFTGSGGTVTYTATGLSDTAAAFSGLGTSGEGAQYVRALPVLRTNSGAAVTYDGTRITDTAATFTGLAIKEGQIVRAGDAFAVVLHAKSATELWIEGWLSDTDRSPVAPPAAGTAYTLYDVNLLRLTATTATTLTGLKWSDLDGNTVTPAAGTRYEVLKPHSNYCVQGGASVRDVRVLNNTCKRGYSDQISTIGGSRWTIANNEIEWAQTFGITIETGEHHICQGNRVRRNGGGGIFCSSTDTVIAENDCLDNEWLNAGGTPERNGDLILVDCQRVTVAHNILRRLASVISRWGIVLLRGTGTAPADNLITGNQSSGHTTGFISIESGATKTKLRDNVTTETIQDLGTRTDYGPGRRFKSGLYYAADVTGADTTLALTLDQLRVAPFPVGQHALSFSALALEVTTAGAAGALLRLVLYEDAGGYPGKLIVDGGTVSAETTGAKEVAITQSLSPGTYWVGAVAQGAVCTVRAKLGVPAPLVGQTDAGAGGGVNNSGFLQTPVSGAAPAAFTSVVTTTQAVPKVMLKAA